MTDLADTGSRTRGPVAWMAGHSVAANLAMLVCLVGGFLALGHVKQEVFPNLERDVVIVSVAYPGASPAEVERGVVLAIEESVQGLDGVKEVTATANEGYGRVEVEALLGADVRKLADDVRNAVDRIRTFPDDAEAPEVRLSSWSRRVLELVIYGPVDNAVLHELSERARDQLLQNETITQVEVEGLPPLEIAVEIAPEALRRYGLTLDDVAGRLARESIERPGGGLKTAGGEILVRVTERRDWGREFTRMPIITTADGSQVRLGEIATLRDGFADTDRSMRFNGHPAVALEVYRVGDQTPVQVSRAVRAELIDLRADLPAGVEVAIQGNRADHYHDRVRLLVKNGLLGLCLVLLLLGLFLEARLAFWVMMGIPISFLGSFLFLPSADVTINMMTLFAYIIAIGIVVDDAVVVGENTYRYMQQGLAPMTAAVRGAREVAMPVTFSVLTNCVSFMPIYFIPGLMGRVFRMIPVVVCIVFLISLVECLFILPSHLGHKRTRRRRGPLRWLHDRQQGFSDAFHTWTREHWRPLLAFALHHRAVTISLTVTFPLALLVIYAMLAIPFRSYVQPLIVMMSIPFGIVGAFLGHLIMGYDLCLPSMFGIVALAGVVVNDSLVLVDFANRRRRADGLTCREAVIDAGAARFRPVILTTLTTFGGLSPMIFETSRQARFLIPMALSLGFGILFATFITLVLVPSLYVCVDDVARYARAARRVLAGADAPPAAEAVAGDETESVR